MVLVRLRDVVRHNVISSISSLQWGFIGFMRPSQLEPSCSTHQEGPKN